MEEKKNLEIAHQPNPLKEVEPGILAWPRDGLSLRELIQRTGLVPKPIDPPSPGYEEWVAETPVGVYLVPVPVNLRTSTKAAMARTQGLLRVHQALRASEPLKGVALSVYLPTIEAPEGSPPGVIEAPEGSPPGVEEKEADPSPEVEAYPPPEKGLGEGDFLTRMEVYLRRNRRKLPKDLSPRALDLYAHLLTAGLMRLITVKGRPSRALKQVTVFAPIGVLVKAVGMSRATLYEYLRELKETGLIDWRPWHTQATVKGRPGVYKGGVVITVRLAHRKGRARVYAEDLREKWRDLDQDIEAGRLAWREEKTRREGGEGTKQYIERKDRLRIGGVRLILSWSRPLSPREIKTPLPYYCLPQSPAPRADDLLADLLRLKPKARRQAVEGIAKGIAEALGDGASFHFYAWAIWHALRGYIYGYAPGAMRVVLWAIGRACQAKATGSIRRPGALVVHLLKDTLEVFRSAPGWRVA